MLGSLAESSTYTAQTAIALALEDPDPEVVAQALESLSLQGDETMQPLVEPLLQHPDSRVREQAELTNSLFPK